MKGTFKIVEAYKETHAGPMRLSRLSSTIPKVGDIVKASALRQQYTVIAVTIGKGAVTILVDKPLTHAIAAGTEMQIIGRMGMTPPIYFLSPQKEFDSGSA